MAKKMLLYGLKTLLLLLLLAGGIVQAQEAIPHHVVILVVDDFSTRLHGDIFQNQEATDIIDILGDQYLSEEGPDFTLCYFNPITLVEGQAMADGMGGAAFDDAGVPISHGDLVLAQTIEMISDLEGDLQTQYPDVVITAVPVHVGDYVISDIREAIENTMEGLKQSIEPGQVSFVINMSFALVPCKLYDQLVDLAQELIDSTVQSDWAVFQQALEAISQEMESISRDFEFRSDIQCLLDFSDDSTLYTEVTEESTGEATEEAAPDLPTPGPSEVCVLHRLLLNSIPVASSGNFGLAFPTWPAAWRGVISVSAGPECEGFDSAGGPENRLISQRGTLPDTEPVPWCPPGNLLAERVAVILTNVAAGTHVLKYVSSSGEIMMPGIWDYGTGLLDVQNLAPAGLKALLDPTDVFYASDVELQAFETRMGGYTLSLPLPSEPLDLISGTSFAAPRMSFAMALYLANAIQNGNTVCRGAPNNTISFAYADPLAWNGEDLSLADQTTMQPRMGSGCLDFYATNIPTQLSLMLR